MSQAFSLSKVDRSDPTPKYLQAREILIEAIRSGSLAPGTKLPSTKEISTLFDISLITAHKALEGLVETGWLRREVGRGTYVRDDINPEQAVQGDLLIGLVMDPHVNIDDYYHSTIINTLRQEARTAARRVEFFFHDRFDLRQRSTKQDTCAICIHPPLEMQERVEALAMERPVVVLGGAFPNEHVTTIDCDNVGGARQAVRHLIELGHKRFMVLSGPMNLSNARDRANGAMDELAAHGIRLADIDKPVSQDSVVLDDNTKAALEERLRQPDRPTAIVAGGFYLALAAIQSVRAAGLSIPEDVSLVGFDDPASAPLLDPPLTTVRQPLPEMAATAFQSVCAAVADGREMQPSVKLATELIVRKSTGPMLEG